MVTVLVIVQIPPFSSPPIALHFSASVGSGVGVVIVHKFPDRIPLKRKQAVF